jgi:hypothetical protein
VPWGLIVLLVLYFGGIWLFVRLEYHHSPRFQAARHLHDASLLLGSDDGRTAPLEDLKKALDHLLAALSVFTDDHWAHQRLEQVIRRLKERKVSLSREQQGSADALSQVYRRIQDGKAAILVVGVYDLWDVDAVLNAPQEIMNKSVYGGLLIVLLWMYRARQESKLLGRMALDRQDERRRDLDELNRHRKRDDS